MKLTQIPFNLDLTLCCGQVFNWTKKDNCWYGVIEETPVKISQFDPQNLEFENVSSEKIKNYFSLDDNLGEIAQKIARDEYIKEALSRFWGLRIIKQNPWECLISYICATYKSIAAIRSMLFKLSKKFGIQKKIDNFTFYTFPKPIELHSAKTSDLIDCGLGYRSKYVLETTKIILNNNSFFVELRKKPYIQAKKQLIQLPGVGHKVADCILLFSLGKTDAFPVDIWVKRAIINHYSDYFDSQFLSQISKSRAISNSAYQRINEFGRNYFGLYAGYAQEYLFHFERMNSSKKKN